MKRVYWMIAVLLMLSLALAACGGGEEPAAPAETAVEAVAEAVAEAPAETEAEAVAEAPAEAPAETVAEAVAEAPMPEREPVSMAELNLSSTPDNLSSYRYEMTFTVTGTDENNAPIDQSIIMLLAFTTEPPAMSMRMTAEGVADAEGMGTFEMVQIGDTSYMVMAEMGCVAFPAQEEDLLNDPMISEMSPEEMFADLENLRFVGEETRNGVDVLHYMFDESSVPQEDLEGLRDLEGHVYVAKDGGYMVAMLVDMQGAGSFMEELEGAEDGRVQIEFNLLDINSVSEILPPAGCEGQGAGAELEFPVLAEATEMFNFPGMISYTTTAVSLAEAIEFYQNGMADAGYTYAEAESFVADSTALLTFLGDGETVNVSLSVTDGEVAVTIFTE